MLVRINMSKNTEELFCKITGSEQIKPYALAKLAIALSLYSEKPLEESDFKTDNLGKELHRQTITAEYDLLFKSLIQLREKKHISDDEYFRDFIKAHLDRGAKFLFNEHKYGGTFLTHLLELDKAI